MPDAVSSSLLGNLANFTGISPSSSTVVSPPLLSVPISYAVPPPASTLNPIFQPAIQAQTPLVHSAVPKQDSILQAAVNTPDPILQAARSEMDLQAEAVAQAQSRLRALTQAHAAAVGDVYARAQELASVGSLSASLAIPSPNQQLLMPPSAGLAAPGMFLPSGRAHPLPFVIGPGFLPVPDKTGMNIISGQYIDLASLLARPSDSLSPGPLVCLDGRVVVSAALKPPRRLTDISQWLQAFAIYMLILIRYQLLILRTQSQFGGLAWYHYDEAFRRDAAARRVVDWSAMHVELCNFHTSVATRTLPDSSPGRTRESSGAQFGTTICRSWSAGRCVATRATCRYLHVCDLPRCRGAHRRINCPNQPPSPPVSSSSSAASVLAQLPPPAPSWSRGR